ncbi:MAG TPA: hypothetical protein VEU30_14960 [Thermoanaerobaculia bacterium]|nr:hypothetical protein [Thermoanaerobaculia bacterium]
MATFLAAILAYPTVVFTALVSLFLLYSLATVLGALDIHWLDGVLGIDHAPDSVLEGALSFLGVAGVPITIVGGVGSIFAWMTSIAASRFLPDSILFGTATLIGSGIVGLGLAGLAVRPLRGFFNAPPAASRKGIVGKICTVRSLRVDDLVGVAEVQDGAAGFIAEIRCFRDNKLTIGSKAIVYDYDHHSGTYHVGPLDPSITSTDYVVSARQTDIA